MVKIRFTSSLDCFVFMFLSLLGFESISNTSRYRQQELIQLKWQFSFNWYFSLNARLTRLSPVRFIKRWHYSWPPEKRFFRTECPLQMNIAAPRPNDFKRWNLCHEPWTSYKYYSSVFRPMNVTISKLHFLWHDKSFKPLWIEI